MQLQNIRTTRAVARGAFLAVCVCAASPVVGADSDAAKAVPKQIPPPGIEVPKAQRERLQQELDSLAPRITRFEQSKVKKTADLAPDVRIYWKAVDTALNDHEFFKPPEINAAVELLGEARRRVASLEAGEAPWTTAHGLVVRGYVSRLDGSVQPYGLVIPDSYAASGFGKFRLDIWFHGRGETLNELNFLRERSANVGTFAPRDTIVLHPYGRYCNANKFAGEVDVFEALDSVRRRYRIDDDRIVIRGFSMGGASTWHLAVHYPDRWAAANPGAGFAETLRFSKHFHKEMLEPTWWETKLFHLYDATDWAGNLWHCPTIAYSGELDRQKQAADVMAEALAKEGLELRHIIGPKTTHTYEPKAREEIDRLVGIVADKGRDELPDAVRFTTYTLRYNRCEWVTIDALDRHWERARIEAHGEADGGFSVFADNVSAFTLAIPPVAAPIRSSMAEPIVVHILTPRIQNAERPPQNVTVKVLTRSDRSWTASFHLDGDRWLAGPLPPGLWKKHGLQGPIDDAFMEPFLFVRPTATGNATHPEVDAWVHREMERAITEWRRQFRGTPRVKDDRDITAADIASMNLVLWGDAATNSVLGRINDKLPIHTKGSEIVVGDRQFDAAHHAPILIYPNPLNPERYVVLNSGFTFREHAYLSNAYQVPKLPDWAIIDVRTPADANWPGKVVTADFFDEEWQLRPPRGE
jgi:Prolyl oligopeptidase family